MEGTWVDDSAATAPAASPIAAFPQPGAVPYAAYQLPVANPYGDPSLMQQAPPGVMLAQGFGGYAANMAAPTGYDPQAGAADPIRRRRHGPVRIQWRRLR